MIDFSALVELALQLGESVVLVLFGDLLLSSWETGEEEVVLLAGGFLVHYLYSLLHGSFENGD